MNSSTIVIIAANVVTLLFGGAIVYLAHRAYARTGSTALRALAAGLGLVTLGTFAGGIAHQLLDVSLLNGIAVQSAFTALGFVILAYSLYAE
ncbi:DUF7521 family protein [Natrinema zhouii]|uniref:DUF7521 family protein n=1 Tax=Natrinema zhouii TaxID=1710539 RepID=UPI003CE5A535